MQPEDIDKLFRDRLSSHAPAPPAHLWSQLEEELRPTKKRPVLWMWAAAVALLLAGGVLWLQLAPVIGPGTARLTTRSQPARPANPLTQAREQPEKKSVAVAETQATTPQVTASSPSKAVASPRWSPGARPESRQQVASSSRRSPARVPVPHVPTSPPTQTPESSVEVLATTAPKVQPPRASTEVATPPPTTLAATTNTPVPTGPIDVQVRRSTEPAAVATAEVNARRSLGGIILRQARNAVRGDRVSLTETGLPETVTVQAHVAGRTITKVIQL